MPRYEYHLIAKCRSCGQIVAAHIDDPTDREASAQVKADWLDEGYIVDRVTQAYVRANFSTKGCRCEKVGK